MIFETLPPLTTRCVNGFSRMGAYTKYNSPLSFWLYILFSSNAVNTILHANSTISPVRIFLVSFIISFLKNYLLQTCRIFLSTASYLFLTGIGCAAQWAIHAQ